MSLIANATQTRVGNGARWSGRILSAVAALVLLADGLVSLLKPELVAGAMAETGFPAPLAVIIGSIAVVSAILYAIPQTAVLGAILVTGFLGGAICTHLRVGEIGSPPQLVSLAIGIVAWAGLYLRLGGVRALLPVVK